MKKGKRIRKRQVRTGFWKKFLRKVSGRGCQIGTIEHEKFWMGRKKLWRGQK